MYWASRTGACLPRERADRAHLKNYDPAKAQKGGPTAHQGGCERLLRRLLESVLATTLRQARCPPSYPKPIQRQGPDSWKVDVPHLDNNPDDKVPFVARDGMLSLGSPGGHLVHDENQNYRLEVNTDSRANRATAGFFCHRRHGPFTKCSQSPSKCRCTTRTRATSGIVEDTAQHGKRRPENREPEGKPAASST